MPFRELDQDAWKKSVSRALVVGPPNSRKTSSLATWPRPIHWISYPGEKGHSSIPAHELGIKAYIWEEEDYKKFSPLNIINEIDKLTTEILTGQKGEVATFAGDGLHKLYEFYYLQELASLLNVFSNSPDPRYAGKTTEELEESLGGKAYGKAHQEFTHYLSKVCLSTIPNVVFTCWDGMEKDNPEAKGGPSHIFPDLPGKMARRIMGEFSVVLYAEVGLADPQGNAVATWQLRPGGKIWGAGVKIPVDIAKRLPQKVPQDWGKLYPILLGEVQKQEAEPRPLPKPQPIINPKPLT